LSRGEIRKARSIVQDLEKAARLLRKGLARHRTDLSKFKRRVSQLGGQAEGAARAELFREAEQMLPSTLRLATRVAAACDRIRQQANRLTSLTEVRTDPLTGVVNRRGLDEAIAAQLAVMSRYKLGFSLLIVEVDHFKRPGDKQGHLEGARLLGRVARLLGESAREVDSVACCGGEQFAVVMPKADLEGAAAFAERVRAAAEQELRITVSGGLTTSLDGDTAESLLARAEAALHEAQAAGRNRVFRHDGTRIEPILEDAPTEALG
jgi:diguanylate cyclase (GGDEF)-like protein